jgi:RHS repeat-associated protein
MSKQTSLRDACTTSKAVSRPVETVPEYPQASYYRARYYDQNAGRFLSEDPIRFKTGVDFYRYVRNRPTSLVDWSGLSPATCGCNILTRIAQGAAIGTVGGAIVGGVSGGLAGAVGGGAAGTLALPGGGTLAGGAVGAAEGAAGGAWLGSRVGAFLGSAIGAIVGTVECLNNNEDSCWVQYENDVSLCRTLPSSGARARCYASAMQRYANCRAGREPGPLVDE